MDSMTKYLACELGPHGIRVNAVNPTVVWTELAKAFWSDPEKSKTIMPRIPLGRFAGTFDFASCFNLALLFGFALDASFYSMASVVQQCYWGNWLH
jgi:NAD(P)-dependent dehydrogenase (short-subunit alcohol dehydrogenase family)